MAIQSSNGEWIVNYVGSTITLSTADKYVHQNIKVQCTSAVFGTAIASNQYQFKCTTAGYTASGVKSYLDIVNPKIQFTENADNAVEVYSYDSAAGGYPIEATVITDYGASGTGYITGTLAHNESVHFVGHVPRITNATTVSSTTRTVKLINVTPGASNKFIQAEGWWGTDCYIQIDGDADLVASNIKNGVNIFGVVGTYTGSGGTSNELCVLPSVSKEGQTYGWVWNTTQAGLMPENSKTIHGSGLPNTFAYGKLAFNLKTTCSIKIDYYQDSERNYDYMILSNLNQELSKTYTADSSYAHRTYGVAGAGSYTYSNVAAGEKFITFKYRKDGSGDTGGDYCKITKITITPTTTQTAPYGGFVDLGGGGGGPNGVAVAVYSDGSPFYGTTLIPTTAIGQTWNQFLNDVGALIIPTDLGYDVYIYPNGEGSYITYYCDGTSVKDTTLCYYWGGEVHVNDRITSDGAIFKITEYE